jgi:parvulin-like peptidyl-prolyl isomerase
MMKRTLLALALLATAAPTFAQSNADKLVARVNGEEITNRELDAVWGRVPQNVQAQYAKVGGKEAFLKNYVAKHLLVQDAVKSGFAAKIGAPRELDAETESALFDQYVREVIAAPLITEADMQMVYDLKKSEFVAPEQGRLKVIKGLKKDKPEIAREAISKAMVEIFAARTSLAERYGFDKALPYISAKFSEIAARISDDPSAKEGGDLGWVALHTLDPKIAEAVRTMKPGTVSGILDTRDAFQLVLVEEYRPSGVQTFESAKPAIREFIMARDAKRVMDAVSRKSAELRAQGKVEIFPENVH